MQRFFESEKRIRSGTVPLADGKKKYFDPIWNPSWFALSKYCEDASPIKDRKNANILAYYESFYNFDLQWPLNEVIITLVTELGHILASISLISTTFVNFFLIFSMISWVTLKSLQFDSIPSGIFPVLKAGFFSVFRIGNLISFEFLNVRWHFLSRRQYWILLNNNNNQTKCQPLSLLNITNCRYRCHCNCIIDFRQFLYQMNINKKHFIFVTTYTQEIFINLKSFCIITIRRHAQNDIG